MIYENAKRIKRFKLLKLSPKFPLRNAALRIPECRWHNPFIDPPQSCRCRSRPRLSTFSCMGGNVSTKDIFNFMCPENEAQKLQNKSLGGCVALISLAPYIALGRPTTRWRAAYRDVLPQHGAAAITSKMDGPALRYLPRCRAGGITSPSPLDKGRNMKVVESRGGEANRVNDITCTTPWQYQMREQRSRRRLN